MARIVVIGAGIGGLAAAARLARTGFEVTVFEKEDGPGGRCQVVREAGFTWDLGPTILLYPKVLAEHFAACGARAPDRLELARIDPRYRVNDADGAALTFHDDMGAMRRELGDDFEGYARLLELARRQEEIAFGTFLARPFDSLLSARAAIGIVRGRALSTVWRVVAEHVKSEHARRALTFQTMYLGLSPFEAPGLFALLAHAEAAHGVWYAKGGVGRIGEELARLAEECGARIVYGRAARAIEERAVCLDDGERVRCDAVLVNLDWPSAQRTLLGRRPREYRPSSSAYVLLLGCARAHEELLHHNVYFGTDFEESFEDLFARGRVPKDPSFYVTNAARTDPSVAPPGKSALYVLVPVPSLAPRGPDWDDAGTRRAIRERVIARLGLSDVEIAREVTPNDWARRFGLYAGAAFGLAHTLGQVGALRPGHKDHERKNVYYVGASVQPATGIPNVLLGAKMVAARMREEL